MKRSLPYSVRVRAFRPALEQLETRLVPTVTLQHVDLDHDGAADDFLIRGDSQNTRIQILDNPANDTMSVLIDANGDGDFADTDLGDKMVLQQPISKKSVVLDIALGAGNDQVDYQTIGGDFTTSSRKVLLNLGQGDDQFLFNAEGRSLINSNLRFNVNAGEGNDTVDFELTDVTNSRLSINEVLGGGNDASDIVFSGNMDLGSALRLSANLGNGTNQFFVGLQGVGVTDFATARIDVLGGNDALNKDVVEVDLNDAIGNGIKESDLTINANLRAGDDVFWVELDQCDFKLRDGSHCTIVAHGGAGDDSLEVESMGELGFLSVDAGAVLDARLYGDAGADQVSVSIAPDASQPLLELNGTLRVQLHGGAGNDQMNLNLANTDNSTGAYDLALFGDAGDDAIGVNVNTGRSTATFGPTGFILANGGAGFDTLGLGIGATNVKAVEIEVGIGAF